MTNVGLLHLGLPGLGIKPDRCDHQRATSPWMPSKRFGTAGNAHSELLGVRPRTWRSTRPANDPAGAVCPGGALSAASRSTANLGCPSRPASAGPAAAYISDIKGHRCGDFPPSQGSQWYSKNMQTFGSWSGRRSGTMGLLGASPAAPGQPAFPGFPPRTVLGLDPRSPR